MSLEQGVLVVAFWYFDLQPASGRNGIEVSGQHRGNGCDDPPEDHEPEVRPQVPRGGDGPGGWGNQGVGGVKAGGECNGHGRHSGPAASGHRTIEGREDDEARIAEDGDGDDPAD